MQSSEKKNEIRSVFEAVKASLISGEMTRKAQQIIFSKRGFMFAKSEKTPGMVDKVFEDGSRVTGQVVNGEFVVTE